MSEEVNPFIETLRTSYLAARYSNYTWIEYLEDTIAEIDSEIEDLKEQE